MPSIYMNFIENFEASCLRIKFSLTEMCVCVHMLKASYYHTHCAARRRYQQPFTATLFERNFDDIVERQFLPSLEFIKPCRY